MNGHICMVGILNLLVNFFLLIGVSRILSGPVNYLRTVLAAGVGGLYGAVCMVDGFFFLGGFFWRLVSMGLMTGIAFGISRSSLRRGVLFVLLHLALTGATAGLGGGIWTVLAAGATVALMGTAAFFERPGRFVPVELQHGGRRLCLTALRDTGNTLVDPVTGRSVLVVGADVAGELTGLTPRQLRSPVEVMQAAEVPGLRLIPYKTIDRSSGMLLAMRVQEVKIGSWKGSALVAFAPEGLDEKGRYQALTGGAA